MNEQVLCHHGFCGISNESAALAADSSFDTETRPWTVQGVGEYIYLVG